MNKIAVILICMACLAISSCKDDSTSSSADVSVYLQDAPDPTYEKIKIELKGVSIYSQSSGSWLTLTVNNGAFDLLTLDSLHQSFLGKLKIQEGDISDLELIIGNQNSVTVLGIDYPLTLDAADLDKLKIKMSNHLNGGLFYKLTIDFKATESIDKNGNIYKLKASLKISIKEV